MIKAFYSAASGMMAQTLKQDVIANNIANAQTAGFKKERLVSSSFAETLEKNIDKLDEKPRPNYPNCALAGVSVRAEAASDNTQGAIRPTGNNLDFAITGAGSFEVQTDSGTRLTREGNFMLNANGELCTATGSLVMGQNGPIKMPEGQWNVASDGTINVDGSVYDTIKIVGAEPDKTQLLQGNLESANVNVVSEMVEMITNMRSFEANQKVLQNVDRTLDKMINEGGKV